MAWPGRVSFQGRSGQARCQTSTSRLFEIAEGQHPAVRVEGERDSAGRPQSGREPGDLVGRSPPPAPAAGRLAPRTATRRPVGAEVRPDRPAQAAGRPAGWRGPRPPTSRRSPPGTTTERCRPPGANLSKHLPREGNRSCQPGLFAVVGHPADDDRTVRIAPGVPPEVGVEGQRAGAAGIAVPLPLDADVRQGPGRDHLVAQPQRLVRVGGQPGRLPQRGQRLGAGAEPAGEPAGLGPGPPGRHRVGGSGPPQTCGPCPARR